MLCHAEDADGLRDEIKLQIYTETERPAFAPSQEQNRLSSTKLETFCLPGVPSKVLQRLNL